MNTRRMPTATSDTATSLPTVVSRADHELRSSRLRMHANPGAESPTLAPAARAWRPSAFGMAALVVLARGQQVRTDQGDEGARLRRQHPALAHDHAVAARREERRQRARTQAGVVALAQADRGHDRHAQAHGHVLLDHVPAADLKP